MKVIADLHIHSKFSRATSKNLDLSNLEKYARIKGIDLIGTGDFTHPGWIKELKEKLKEDGSGILRTRTGFPFVLQTEISLIYTQGDKGRRIHNVILAKNFDVVDQIIEYLVSKGRIDYDGRPIFRIPCPEFTESLKKIDKDIEIIPAHVWTPYFGLFGSMTGFDSVGEGFGDQAKHIFALETGLSSDPAMNWRLSKLDRYSLVSFSDLHSFWPWRIGREATVFEFNRLNYDGIIKALHTKEGLKETIEVDPGYGKYHFDGHRDCNICFAPSESLKLKNICPRCGKGLTIGVAHRVEELADREEGYELKDAVPFKSLIPLSEGKTELDILLETPLDELKKLTDEKIAEAIIANREGKIKIEPGYDGEYGYPVFGEKDIKEVKDIKNQRFLGSFRNQRSQKEIKKTQKGLSEFM